MFDSSDFNWSEIVKDRLEKELLNLYSLSEREKYEEQRDNSLIKLLIHKAASESQNQIVATSISHIDIKDNLENQEAYSSKISEILEGMNIFDTEEINESKEENSEEGSDNSSNENDKSENEDQKDQNTKNETETSLDADYDIDDLSLIHI